MCRKPTYDVDLEQKWDEESRQLHHWLCNQNGLNFMLRKSLIQAVRKERISVLKYLLLHVVEDLVLRQMKFMLFFLGSHSSLGAVVYLCILFNILMLLMLKAFLSEE